MTESLVLLVVVFFFRVAERVTRRLGGCFFFGGAAADDDIWLSLFFLCLCFVWSLRKKKMRSEERDKKAELAGHEALFAVSLFAGFSRDRVVKRVRRRLGRAHGRSHGRRVRRRGVGDNAEAVGEFLCAQTFVLEKHSLRRGGTRRHSFHARIFSGHRAFVVALLRVVQRKVVAIPPRVSGLFRGGNVPPRGNAPLFNFRGFYEPKLSLHVRDVLCTSFVRGDAYSVSLRSSEDSISVARAGS